MSKIDIIYVFVVVCFTILFCLLKMQIRKQKSELLERLKKTEKERHDAKIESIIYKAAMESLEEIVSNRNKKIRQLKREKRRIELIYSRMKRGK